MTSHASLGTQRPRPLLGISRPPSRTPSYAKPSPIGPPGKQVFIDLTDNDLGDNRRDHPAKRLKLDRATDGADGNNSPASINAQDHSANIPTTHSSQRAGRPPWVFEERLPDVPPTTQTISTGELLTDSAQSRSSSPPRLPIRPWKFGPRLGQQHGAPTTRESLRNGEVLTVPYSLDPSPATPRYKSDKPTDFFPWVGNHPEDVLNEHTAKQGHWDRVTLSQNETHSARPSLYSIFKSRPNLQALSSLFISALEQRQIHGKISSASTFKPPPRVTLTDTKRESWLRDLANSSVPLRKLSRTIPHGIRGKVLLDQCLGKGIPVGRALWLAKCVGANEIRAFKRKGTSGAFAIGGETKWIKDWTICVEQFVEGVISICGEANWRERFTYAIGLSARLYNERLVDQEHYLTWILTSLESATLDKLPVWLSVSQLYCEDLLRYRKTARHLTSGLLERLQQTKQADVTDVLGPIAERLSQFIRHLAVAFPSSFILPDSWQRLKETLASCLDLSIPTQYTVFESLDARNNRLTAKSDHQAKNRILSVRERTISILDKARAPYEILSIATECSSLIENADSLVDTVVEWATTVFRESDARMYLAIRLLRHWSRRGLDIDGPILGILASPQKQHHLQATRLFHLISELVRSQTFGIGRYLQWLIARGALSDVSTKASQRWDVRLLAELPRYRVPTHIWNLRNVLLARTNLPGATGEQVITLVKSHIRARYPQIFTADIDEDEISKQMPSFTSLGWSMKSELGQWIRNHVSSYYKKPKFSNMGTKSEIPEEEVSALSSGEFFGIRDLLEQLQDVSMLADFLRDACNAEDVDVLSSAADTINFHFESLAAIGAYKDLYHCLLDGYNIVKTAELPTRVLITNLIDLGNRIPSEAPTVRWLQQELKSVDRNTSLAACSPVSDSMMGNLQSADINLDDEIEQLLGSGTRIEDSIMGKVFDALSDRLALCDGSEHVKIFRINILFLQLKTFNEPQFDALMLKWMSSLLKQDTQLFSKVAPLLVGSGCLSFQSLISNAAKSLSKPTGEIDDNQPSPHMILLHLAIPPEEIGQSASSMELYRFGLEQRAFLDKFPGEILSLIHDATIEAAITRQETQPLEEISTIRVLRNLVVHHTDLVIQKLLHPILKKSQGAKSALERGINLLLSSDLDDVYMTSDPVNSAKAAIQSLNDFSLPFCRLKLELLYGQNESIAGNDAALCEVIFETAKSNVKAGTSHWTDIVSRLHPRVARYVREKAEDQFMAVARLDEPTPANQQNDANLCLKIIEEMAYSIPETGVPAIAPFLIDQMNMLSLKLSTDQQFYSNNTPPAPSFAAPSQIPWFSLLLRLTLAHRTGLSRTSSRMDLSRLILSITNLASLPYFNHLLSLSTFAFDVATALTDDLSDEVRATTARYLRETVKTRDPRLMFLFGFCEEPGDELMISQRGKLWPWGIRRWEMLEESAPVVGVNDTAVSLGLFQARKV